MNNFGGRPISTLQPLRPAPVGRPLVPKLPTTGFGQAYGQAFPRVPTVAPPVKNPVNTMNPAVGVRQSVVPPAPPVLPMPAIGVKQSQAVAVPFAGHSLPQPFQQAKQTPIRQAPPRVSVPRQVQRV